MWWVGGSHLINFWAIWSVGWKETHVAPNIRYILPAAHIFNNQHMWPALAKQGTSQEWQAADFTFSINQYCRVFTVSDNHLDHYFQFVKDMAL